MQTKQQSLVETLVGTCIGFVIALAGQTFITWWYNVPTSHAQDVWITVFFTCLSIIRGYGVRRFFNWLWGKPAVIVEQNGVGDVTIKFDPALTKDAKQIIAQRAFLRNGYLDRVR